MTKLVTRENAITKVVKSGMALRLCKGQAIAKEFSKEKVMQNIPIVDYCVAVISPDGEMTCLDDQEQVTVMFSSKYKICWVECLKPVSCDTITESSDRVVYEPTLIKGKIIIMWAEKTLDSEDKEGVLKHYLTADISDEGAKFAHVEEMFYTKELLNTLMTVMAQMKKKEELESNKGTFTYIGEMVTE